MAVVFLAELVVVEVEYMVIMTIRINHEIYPKQFWLSQRYTTTYVHQYIYVFIYVYE